jgi:hypothetical protein
MERQSALQARLRPLPKTDFCCWVYIQVDSKLLSGFPLSINGNPDSNLESSCIFSEIKI